MRLRLPLRMVAMVCAGLVTISLAACTRNAADAKPTISAGVPPAVTVAAADFPSFWVAERVGGDAIDLRLTDAADLAASEADLIAYVPGIDPAVDAAVADLPDERVVDVVGDVSLLASVRNPQVKDPYAWFDPVNVAKQVPGLRELLELRATLEEARVRNDPDVTDLLTRVLKATESESGGKAQ